jgi:hypothetical protein
VGPKAVPYEPFSRDRVGRYVRQNDDPTPFLTTRGLQGRCASMPRPPDPQKRSAAAARKPRAGAAGLVQPYWIANRPHAFMVLALRWQMA